MKEKVILEIPKEDLEEVIHLIRYSLCDQRVSNDVWTLLATFCEDNSQTKFDDRVEEFLHYSTKYDNNDMYEKK